VTADRFGAAAIRRRVLTAWSDSPARFREDANAEEDLVLGGYRDRLVVELAQNAADAAARVGARGRLLLTRRDGVLVAANTGAPLDADGVQALATLRASAKRDSDTVGRFGVGFAAVLAVTDEPAVLSRSGGVRFSAADTRQLLREAAARAPGLTDELTRRDGHVPTLRLPFETEGTPPGGYDTAVVLPLRDRAAEDLTDQLLDRVDDTLLLALPDLAEIVIENGDTTRRLADVEARWRILTRRGQLPPSVLATRPVEERGRTRWQLTWALPRTDTPYEPVVHAPTPSDEPLPWPALLVAGFPLDPARRHVADGPVTDAILAEAAAAYTALLEEHPGDAWELVVTGLPAGRIDGLLRERTTEKLRHAAILRAAEDEEIRLKPANAVALEHPVGADEQVVKTLSGWLAGLVLAPRRARAAFDLLGVRRLALADVVESLLPVKDPARWHEVYAAFAPLAGDEQVREALAFLPVPLADGTVARGVRGLLTSTSRPETAEALAVLGARIVHPEAGHPLLERLGATAADARALLELPAVREATQYEDLTDEKRDAVLTLVRAAVDAGSLQPGDLPWLGDLPLPDEDGEPTPAAALALPGSPAARWFDDREIGLASSRLLDDWGTETLTALGVLDGPAVVRASDVALDDEAGPDLDGWDDWCALALDEAGSVPGAVLTELVAVRDLDLVRPEALPEMVAAIAADPGLRTALIGPARVVADGRPVDVPPYTAWWLREELGRTGALAGPDAHPGLRALLPEAPGWVTTLDPAAQRALGVVRDPSDLDAAAVPGVLDRLADDDVAVPAVLLAALLARLAELAARGLDVPRPDRVRGLDDTDGAATVVVEADRAFVADAPMYRQRTDLGVLLPAPAVDASALADLLDLPLGSELAPGEVADGGREQVTAEEVRLIVPAAPPTWVEHDELLVDGVEVDWWVTAAGEVHAATTDGLARALAWAAGRWELRALVAQVLEEPGQAADVMIDQVFGRPGR
jgi:hypothetical protein